MGCREKIPNQTDTKFILPFMEIWKQASLLKLGTSPINMLMTLIEGYFGESSWNEAKTKVYIASFMWFKLSDTITNDKAFLYSLINACLDRDNCDLFVCPVSREKFFLLHQNCIFWKIDLKDNCRTIAFSNQFCKMNGLHYFIVPVDRETI